MIVTLKNEFLTVQIDQKGAQLCSVSTPEAVEYIWQADPAIWGRHAPLLFPVIGRLKDGRYTLEDQTFEISMHGFARDSVFTVAQQNDTQVVFQLTDSPETLGMFPFPFLLSVTFTLEGKKLTKTCTVENRSHSTMYYELGNHDGFNAPLAPGETMDDYAVVLPGLEVLEPYGMDETGMLHPKGERSIPLTGHKVALKPAVYGLDTVVVDQLPQNRVMLVDKSGRARITLDFPDYPYLGIWTQDKPFDTNYVCLEPWSTLPDCSFVGRGLSEKAGIRTLEAGKSESLTYSVIFD